MIAVGFAASAGLASWWLVYDSDILTVRQSAYTTIALCGIVFAIVARES